MGLLLVSCSAAFPQDEGDDNPAGNVHLGMPLGAPLNPMARFSDFGLGISTGGGYNFTRKHGVIGEFMWMHLFVPGDALSTIRSTSQDPTISGRGELYSFTGNYRFELRGKSLGTYLIAGGGLYYRTAELSHKVVTGNGVKCEPVWNWWGFTCSSGFVTGDQTIAGSSSSALGVNGGIGFTARVSEAPYRVYVESRYHFAPTKSVNTQLVVLTVGIRY